MKTKFQITLVGDAPETTNRLLLETLKKRNYGLPVTVKSLPRNQNEIDGERRRFEIELSSPEKLLPSDIRKALQGAGFSGAHYPKISSVKGR